MSQVFLPKGGNRLFTAGVLKKKKKISDKPSESQTDERISVSL